MYLIERLKISRMEIKGIETAGIEIVRIGKSNLAVAIRP